MMKPRTRSTELRLTYLNSGPAVIVKVYESSLDLKVCDVCEFVGVVALDQPSRESAN